MSRSNLDKPFYVDVGSSVAAIRCASNHDVIVQYDYVWHPHTLQRAKDICDRMNREVEIGRPRRNCDVGTAEEQERRFERFCDSHKWLDDEGACSCSSDCPLYETTKCALHWAQMPYEEQEGGAK